jgi:hypothetical protein
MKIDGNLGDLSKLLIKCKGPNNRLKLTVALREIVRTSSLA